MRLIDADALKLSMLTITYRETVRYCYPCKEVLKAIEETPTIEPQHWIPCSERLPEDGTWNIFTDGKTISVERYKVDVPDHFFPGGRWFQFEDATAWMPLPEPYKGE